MSTNMPPPQGDELQDWYMYASSSFAMSRYVLSPVKSYIRIMASAHQPVSSVDSARKSPFHLRRCA
jgi:hypothetical protein